MSPTSARWVIFLGGGPSQVSWIRAIQAAGWSACVVDREAGCPGASLGERFVHRSIWDPAPIAADVAAAGLARDPGRAVIASNVGGPATLCAQHLAARLGLSFAAEEAAQAAWSKAHFKRLFAEVGGEPAPFALFDEDDFDWPALMRTAPGRSLFIKPEVNIAGKEACRIVRAPDPACPPSLDFGTSRTGRLLVEPYVAQARDLLVLIPMRHGRRLATYLIEELNVHDAGVRSLGFRTAPRLSPEERARVEEVTESLLARLRVVDAPVAISLRAHESGLVPVELHLDFGGENIYSLAAGLDQTEVLGRWLSGEPFPNQATDVVRWCFYEAALDGEDALAQLLRGADGQEVAAATGRRQWHYALSPKLSRSVEEELASD